MRSKFVFSFALLAQLVGSVGCGTAGDGYLDPTAIGVGGNTSLLNPKVDTDGDGAPDVDEGAQDTDGDGQPAHLDPDEVRLDGVKDATRDSDGDGTPDLTEGTADGNDDGVPAYLDAMEIGSGSGTGGVISDGGTGTEIAFGQACSTGDSCASVGTVAGCCVSSSMTCGALLSGSCQSGLLCDGQLCAGSDACCTSSGTCGERNSSGSCGGGGTVIDAGVIDSGTGTVDAGGGGQTSSCPDVEGNTGCCADSGKCSIEVIGGCPAVEVAGLIVTLPDLTCTP